MDYLNDRCASWISNDGWDSIKLRVPEQDLGKAPGYCVVGVQFSGQFWDPAVALERAELVTSFSVTVPNLVIAIATLRELADRLSDWCEAEQRVGSNLVVTLSEQEAADSTITFNLVQSDKHEYGLGQFVLYSAVRCPRFSGELKMVIDETCTRTFSEEIVRLLEDIP